MKEERQPGPWLEALDGRRGDETAAKKAVRRLYEFTGRPVPKAIIWLDSPFAGLLADGYLHRTFFESLFQGDAPPLMEQLMQDHHRWEVRSCEGNYFPSPKWKSLKSGRRLGSQGKATATGLQRRAGEIAAMQDIKRNRAFPGGIPLPPGEKELALAVIGKVREHLHGMPGTASMPEVNGFLEGLPWVFAELGRIPGHDTPPRYARTFNFDPASGTYGNKTTFNLGAPRCINFDQMAENIYAIENLSVRKKPEWYEVLVELAGSAGWLWPFDKVALLSAPASEVLFDDEDRVHHESGPAIRHADGWSLWAIHGDVLPEKAVETPRLIEPDDVLRERDDRLRRVLIERRGREILDDPAWPGELQLLASMVFDLQYCRFAREHIPGGAAPWPEAVPEPTPLGTKPDVAGVPEGLYFSTYPDGQLRVLAGIEEGHVAAWLWLGQGIAEGWLQARHIAQKYYRDGMVEDFSPWDDNSPPYQATQSFEQWVREGIDILAPAARLGKKKR